MNTCTCSDPSGSNFCPGCGAPSRPERINRHYVWHELQHGILHLEKGFLYTTKELLIRPGATVRSFLAGDRKRHYKPIAYVIISSVIFSIVDHWLKPSAQAPTPGTAVNPVMNWVTANYNISNLIEIVFIALLLLLIFRKTGINYLENFVLCCYLSGVAMLFGSLLLIVENVIGQPIFGLLFTVGAFGYCIWGIGQFYSTQAKWSYLKATLAYLSGVIIFFGTAIALGMLMMRFMR